MELKFKKIKGFNLRAFKKALSIFLAAIILLSCLPASVLAETLSLSANIANSNGTGGNITNSTSGDILDEFEITSGYYTCFVSNGKATITDVDESISGDIEIPSTIEGYTVTGIGDDAFYLCDSLTSITIPNSVTSIGDWAFYLCDSLTNITIPDSVTSIGDCAFSYCSSLTIITIGNSVASIGYGAFRYCSSLTNITVSGNNSNYCSVNGVLFNKGKTELIQYPAEKTATEYVIPSSVTSIGNYAFSDCSSLKNIIIPNSVTSIGDEAFSCCSSLTSITIPNGVTSIGPGAFLRCSSLNSVTIPNSVTSIGDYAFSYCGGLTSITIPDRVTSIGNRIFSNCSNLTSIAVSENNSNYYSVNGVLFNKDKTELIQYPAGKTATEYVIPNSATSIGNWAFESCSNLTSVTILNSVISIGNCAFSNCSNLTSVTIPNSVTSIGFYAFLDCNSLTSVMIYSTNCEFDSGCGLSSAQTIYGYSGSTAEALAEEIGAEFIDVETVHTHTFNSGVVTKAATCKEEGIKTHTCTVCGKTKTAAIAKLTTHKYSAATCTKAKTCSVCGTTSGAALGHKFANATCTKAKTCTVCKIAEGKALGHKFANATCTKAKTCSVCKIAEGKALGHTYKNVVTKATLKANGKVVNKCSRCNVVASTTTVYYPKTIKIENTTYTYGGKVITPAITVKGADGKAIAKTNYTVTYAKGRKNVGTYKVTVTFKGNYSGTKAFNFTINPVKTTVNKLVAGKKSLKVTIGKKTNQVTGYEIQYATNKTFKSAKKVNVKSYKTTSVTLNKLTAKKTYYVRVRTFKTVGGKKYYSAWSAAKNKKTK